MRRQRCPVQHVRRAHRTGRAAQLVDAYRVVDGQPLGERKVWLQDDYVKFIRFAQTRIERTGHGVLAFVTNHGYLDNPTFRGMRQSLMKTFDEFTCSIFTAIRRSVSTAPTAPQMSMSSTFSKVWRCR